MSAAVDPVAPASRRNHVLATVGALVVPGFALAATPLGASGELLFVGMIPALVGLMHGRRFAVVAPALTAALVVILVTVGSHPVAATVVLTLVGLGVGAASLRGWQTVAVVMTSWPSVLLVAPPAPLAAGGWLGSSGSVALLAGLATLVGGAWTLLVTSVLLPNPPRGDFEPQPRSTAAVYGVSLALLLGASALAATTWGYGTMAGWVLLTVLVIARPGYSETRRRVVTRSVGTVVGGIAAAAVGLLVPVPLVVTGLGIVCLGVAVILQLKKSSYALYSVALTAAIVLTGSSGGRLLGTDLQRVAFTLAGAVLAGVLVTLLQVTLPRLPRRSCGTAVRAGVEGEISTRSTAQDS